MNAETFAKHCGRAAILIVNSGETPKNDRWIRLCLDRIARYTDYPDYHIYLLNNRIGAPELEAWLASQPHLTLLSAADYETLNHPHRTPLQHLYHMARQDGRSLHRGAGQRRPSAARGLADCTTNEDPGDPAQPDRSFHLPSQSPDNQKRATLFRKPIDDRWRVRDYYAPVNSGMYAIARPDTGEHRRLAAYFEDDVQRTFALCPDLDPALWPDFGPLRTGGEDRLCHP